MKKLLASFLIALTISSCATQTFSVNPNSKREVPNGEPHFSKWSNFFINGIGQNDFRNPNEMCKESDGVAFVETKQSFGQVLVAIVTWGIYTPRTMNIYCNKQ